MKPTKNHITALTNAVRIETLSDDEDVDITDDLSDDDSQTDQLPETGEGQESVEDQDSQGEGSQSPQSPPMPASPSASPVPLAEASLNGDRVEGGDGGSSGAPFLPRVSEERSKTDFEPANTEGSPQEDKSGDPGNMHSCFLFHNVRSQVLLVDIHAVSDVHIDSTDWYFYAFMGVVVLCTDKLENPDEEDQEEEEEEEEIRAPEQEVTLDKEEITEEEKQAIPEFFEGRPAKTPERYLKIRNHILEQW